MQPQLSHGIFWLLQNTVQTRDLSNSSKGKRSTAKMWSSSIYARMILVSLLVIIAGRLAIMQKPCSQAAVRNANKQRLIGSNCTLGQAKGKMNM